MRTSQTTGVLIAALALAIAHSGSAAAADPQYAPNPTPGTDSYTRNSETARLNQQELDRIRSGDQQDGGWSGQAGDRQYAQGADRGGGQAAAGYAPPGYAPPGYAPPRYPPPPPPYGYPPPYAYAYPYPYVYPGPFVPRPWWWWRRRWWGPYRYWP